MDILLRRRGTRPAEVVAGEHGACAKPSAAIARRNSRRESAPEPSVSHCRKRSRQRVAERLSASRSAKRRYSGYEMEPEPVRTSERRSYISGDRSGLSVRGSGASF